jgi:hypothetical protein
MNSLTPFHWTAGVASRKLGSLGLTKENTMLPSSTTPASSHLSHHCHLLPGQAITLRPRRPSMLCIGSGRVWVTSSGPHQVLGRESGDRFLAPGDALRVPAGTRLVLEALTDPNNPQPAHVHWSETVVPGRSEGFARQVLAPARELRRSTAHTLLALQRLVHGLIGWSTGRPA